MMIVIDLNYSKNIISQQDGDWDRIYKYGKI